MLGLGDKIMMVLAEVPIEIQVKKDKFRIYPQTLGRLYLTSQILERLNINKDNLKINSFIEALRLANEQKDNVCLLIAYYTENRKEKLLSKDFILERSVKLREILDNEDLATLLISILSDSKVDEIIKETGLDKEQKRMERVLQAKDSSGQFSFCGKTVWGSMIDVVCERYGWTLDYVLWGISYDNLLMLIKDKVTSIYLTEEERKKGHITSAQEQVINGDNKEEVLKAIMASEKEYE